MEIRKNSLVEDCRKNIKLKQGNEIFNTKFNLLVFNYLRLRQKTHHIDVQG